MNDKDFDDAVEQESRQTSRLSYKKYSQITPQ